MTSGNSNYFCWLKHKTTMQRGPNSIVPSVELWVQGA
jgi:hypothetical protein